MNGRSCWALFFLICALLSLEGCLTPPSVLGLGCEKDPDCWGDSFCSRGKCVQKGSLKEVLFEPGLPEERRSPEPSNPERFEEKISDEPPFSDSGLSEKSPERKGEVGLEADRTELLKEAPPEEIFVEKNIEPTPEPTPRCKPGSKQICFGGKPSQINIGPCKSGERSCEPSGLWGVCQGEVPPAPETCDGLDNDCNGSIDDNVLFANKTCQPTTPIPSAFCKLGRPVCVKGKTECKRRQVTNLADGPKGFSEGRLSPCTQGLFEHPEGLAFDAKGDLFFTESGQNHAIRKLDRKTGKLTTIAGGTGEGYLDGPGDKAKFRYPVGIAVDPSGLLFVVDRYNYVVRMIEKVNNAKCGSVPNYTGYCVSTLAGKAGEASFVDGIATMARFRQSFGIALDIKGQLYVADHDNNRIRKIVMVSNSPCGASKSYTGICVTTLAGKNAGFKDGKGDQAQFNQPIGIAVDLQSVVFVTDRNNHAIRKIDPQGNVTTLAGNGGGHVNGTGANARFSTPHAVAVDSMGSLYVVEYTNHTLRKITSAGVVTTLAGAPGDAKLKNGPLGFTRFAEPTGVAIGPAGKIYITDSGNDVIRVLDQTRSRTLAGSKGWPNLRKDGDALCARFSSPVKAAKDAQGRIYIADQGNNVIYRILSDRTVEVFAGTGEAGYRDGPRATVQFDRPFGLAFDGKGDLYIADHFNHVVRKIDMTTERVSTFAGLPQKPGFVDNKDRLQVQFDRPIGLAFDSKGDLYISDHFNHCIRKIDLKTDIASAWAGSCRKPGYKTGAPGTGLLNYPFGLVFDSVDTLYVADQYNYRVRLIDKMGTLKDLAGSTGGFKDETGPKAQFNIPRHLTLTKNGNLFLADLGNDRIRHIDVTTGKVTTRAGSARGFRNDYALATHLNQPHDVIPFNKQGDLLVLDTDNHALRLVPACP